MYTWLKLEHSSSAGAGRESHQGAHLLVLAPLEPLGLLPLPVELPTRHPSQRGGVGGPVHTLHRPYGLAQPDQSPTLEPSLTCISAVELGVRQCPLCPCLPPPPPSSLVTLLRAVEGCQASRRQRQHPSIRPSWGGGGGRAWEAVAGSVCSCCLASAPDRDDCPRLPVPFCKCSGPTERGLSSNNVL